MTGIPSLKENIACQELLKDPDCRTSSWLRKQSFRNKLQLFRWPQVFVVLCDGCIYYYRNETAKAPSGSFCLYGYNSVLRATEIQPSEAPWAFKIVHTFKEYKTYLFSASSEVEMKDWMKNIKKELKHANNKNIRSSGDGQDGDGDDVSQTYQEIETKIYEDPTEFVVPKDYKNRRNDDFTDDDDIYRTRGPVAPPVPPREREGGRGRKGATMHAARNTVKDLTTKLDRTMDLSKQEQAVSVEHGRTRGSPDGASVKKKVTEVYQDASSVQTEEDEEIDPEKYWAAIHFLSSEREKSSEIIRILGEDGVYLVRDSSSPGEKVLVVFAGDMPRKFKIMWEDNASFLNSKKNVRYPSLEELLHHYYEEPLPGYQVCLATPYKLHPMFKPSMLQ